MADPTTLQYLRSIEDTVKSIDGKVDQHAGRLTSLETTRERQRGIMIAGGAGVTFFSWLVSHLAGKS